jgi:ABC-2 type transport system ATP-binding protein
VPAELVHVSQLSRQFGDRTAVSHVSFSVAAGEIVALLGPNGAGKTTTLRMIAGLIRPSSGQVDVSGRVGFLTEAPGLWERLSVRVNLETYARLHGLADPRQQVDRLLYLFDLQERAEDAAGELSKGLKQRVALARALIHDPAIVLLDEPTSGLDPATARQVRDIILDLRRTGRGVLVSTHNLAEAEELADRIAVLKTRLLALDQSAVLRRRTTGTRVEITIDGSAAPWVDAVRSVTSAEIDAHGARLLVTLPDTALVPDVIAALVGHGARILQVLPDHRSLEEVYLELVGEA